MPKSAKRKPKNYAAKAKRKAFVTRELPAKAKRSPAVTSTLPATTAVQARTSFAKDILEVPVNEIAAEVGKKQADLTASDVMMYSTANLPHYFRKAAWDMWMAPFKAWQSMFSVIAPFSGSSVNHHVK